MSGTRKPSRGAAKTSKRRTEEGFGAGTEERFGNHPTAIRQADEILLTARRIWPAKTADHLAAVCGVSKRCAELWLSGATQMSLPSYLALLWSEHGHAFLGAAMAEAPAPPKWWAALRREQRIALARQAEIEAKQRLRRLEEGEE